MDDLYTPNQRDDKIKNQMLQKKTEQRPRNELNRMSQYVRPNCTATNVNNNTCTSTSTSLIKNPRFTQASERSEATSNKVSNREITQKPAKMNSLVIVDDGSEDFEDFQEEAEGNKISVITSKNQMYSSGQKFCGPDHQTARRLNDRRPLQTTQQFSETLESRNNAEKQLKKADYGSALYANDPQVLNKGFKIYNSDKIESLVQD